MKKIYLLLATLLVLSLTSMILIEKKDQKKGWSETVLNPKPIFQKGMITIKVKEGVGEYDMQRGNVSFGITSLDQKVNKYEVNLLEKRFKYNPEKLRDDLPDLSRIYKIEFPEKYSVTRVAEAFAEDENIEYAEPIPICYLAEEPNDSLYNLQHFLPQIWADSAWKIHKGEDGVEETVIAIIDTGVDWDHEDLVDNIWQNMGEDVDGDGKTIEYIDGEWVFDPDDENGVDDDENGFVDDFIGWDFYDTDNDPNPIPGTTYASHGTHCAGLAGATTDNHIGVASISWNLNLLPIQATDPNGSALYGFDGVIYAAENGADIISNSWATVFYSQAAHEVINYAIGLGSILIAAAHNNNQLLLHMYPADLPGVISVANVKNNDQKAYSSNYGPNIGISSPGVGVMSTMPNDEYAPGSGTSMATPVASGLFGLVRSFHPDWSSDQIIKQVLGTADDIDTLNPGFENMLGSGRINAYKALKDSNVTLDQEISIELIYSICYDIDGDNIFQPGDTAEMSFKLRNYNWGVGAENATFTLKSEDPDIIILDNTCTADIPPDNFFTLENVFQFRISEDATVHFADLDLIVDAGDEIEITWGDTSSFKVMVAPQGILVYQGEGSGNAFSGDFINEFLTNQALQVLYTSHFPSPLNGFDAVFLSFGNYGEYLIDGVFVTMEMTDIMMDYLMQGGKLYAECGSFFGCMDYFDYPNHAEAMQLFGVDTIETPQTSNTINLLTGLPGSICEGQEFDGSFQNPVWYIDKMTPNENGIAAFEEDNYGTVAVQGEGEYGQKTFVFSYALARLKDLYDVKRDSLMFSIVNFFELLNPIANFTSDTTCVNEGDSIYFTDLSANNPGSWDWGFEGGTPTISNKKNPTVAYDIPGTFDVTLIVANDSGSDTLTIADYITVEESTGEPEYYSTNIRIYPNPVKDKLVIIAENEIQSVAIINNTGQIVKKVACNIKQPEVNISGLPEGIYFIRIQMGDEIETSRIIVIR